MRYGGRTNQEGLFQQLVQTQTLLEDVWLNYDTLVWIVSSGKDIVVD